MENFDEPQLLARLRNGDTSAYMTLYDRYHMLVYTWVIHLVKVPEHAEDIVQDVFLKIWEIRERLQPDQSFPAFVYRIGRNKAFNLLKKISSDDQLRGQVMKQLAHTTTLPDNQLLWQQYEQLLKAAIDGLPQQRQKVFRLCRLEGKTYHEAAGELGISPNTVKEHMVTAMKDIRDYFYRYGDISLLLLLLAHH